MTRRLLQLSGSTRIEHDDMTARIAEAISLSGAWLVDFSVFSNTSTTMRVGLPSRQVGAFDRRLRAAGLTLDDASQRSVAAWAADDQEVVATLRVRFVRDEPGLCAAIAAPA